MPNKISKKEAVKVAFDLRDDGMSHRDIANHITNELEYSVGKSTISRWLKGYQDIQELDNAMEQEKTKYEEIDLEGEKGIRIYFKMKDGTKGKYELPLKLLEDMQYYYVNKGANWSKQKIAEHMGIKYHTVNTVFNAFNIYKASNIVSDVKIKDMEESGEDIHQYIDYRIEGGIVDKYKTKYVQSRKHHLEKKGIKAMKRMGEMEAIIEWIGENVQKWGLPKLPKTEKVERDENDFVIESITDLHLGKENSQGILDNIEEVVEVILHNQASTVHLECLGDLGEIFVEGGRHPGQIEGMEGPYGFDLIMLCVEKLSLMIHKIAQDKKVFFYGIGGNHDVFSTAKGGDQPRTAALCIYQMIKERLGNNPNVEVIIPRDMIYTYDVGNFRNIIAHGDYVSKRTLEKVIIEYGDLSKYNIVKYGHLHFLDLKNTNDKGIMIGVPGLAGKGSYDKALLLSSNKGFLEISKNPVSTKPRITNHLLD